MIKLAFETNLNFTTYLLTFENRQQNEKKVFQNKKKKSKNVQILWKIYVHQLRKGQNTTLEPVQSSFTSKKCCLKSNKLSRFSDSRFQWIMLWNWDSSKFRRAQKWYENKSQISHDLLYANILLNIPNQIHQYGLPGAQRVLGSIHI